jgi:DnaJ-class molecular chaperone
MKNLLCPSCDGEGKKQIKDVRNDWEMIKCKRCDGKGRVLTASYSYEVPFNYPKEKLYKLDEEIHKLIRKL